MQRMQLGLVLALSAALARLGAAGIAAEAMTPIARVVGLLKGVSTKLEQDFEAEEKLFQRYECWYKTITEQKTATNSAAESRKESLETHIQDIESGKFEFTTERVDLEKQIAGLKQDSQVAGDLRTKENEDYEAAKQEMEAAVSALQAAIQELEGAAPKSLLARRSTVSFADDRRNMHEALQLAESVLAANDVQFLERMLAGEVPQKDWKKLNRKATFKMKYNSQTERIVKTLKGLEVTFSENLADANQKEGKAKTSYDTLKTSKDEMLSKAEQALIDLSGESGARELTKSEAQEEVDALAAQIKADTQFVTETQTAYKQKKQEWADRERLRRMEITAISEAISVLHSDEARDTFTTSYKSQGYLFLQAKQEQHLTSRTLQSRSQKLFSVVQTLQQLAKAASDPRLSMLATKASAASSSRNHFDAVITAVDNMVTTLKEEENTDLKNKEDCESKRSEKMRQAKVTSVAIDEVTEEINRAQAKVEELEGQISEQDEAVVNLNGNLVEMEQQREDENVQYVKDKADDEKAVALIQKAIGVMDKLKQDMAGLAVTSVVHTGAVKESMDPRTAGLATVGIHLRQGATAKKELAAAKVVTQTVAARRTSASQHQPFEVQAGEAPPPPPPTWSQPTYSGSEAEHSGIHAILSLLKEDMKADIKSADTAEANAVTEYEKQKGDLETAIQAAKDSKTDYEGQKATEDGTVVDKRRDRTSKKGELQGTMDYIKAMTPGCDFVLINYNHRASNRQIEIDGLLKAKAILKGAKFS